MKVTVKYSGHFRDLTGKMKETVEMGDGGTLAHLFDTLCGNYNDLPPFREGLIYLVNGKIAKEEHILEEGDEVNLFQMMAGG